jgi:hypothetical protein
MRRTLSTRAMRREARASLPILVDDARPRTRAECRGGARPCLWVSCRFHLFLDVNPQNGSLKVNFPGREPWELTETCALDVAERGGATQDEIGRALNITRERARQIEGVALDALVDRAL